MDEIKCPECGTVFQISESNYDSILKQVRNKEFTKEVKALEEKYENSVSNAVKLAEANLLKENEEKLNQKDLLIKDLKYNLDMQVKEQELAIKNAIEEKVNTINDLNNKLKLIATENELEIKNVITEKEQKINDLNNKIELDKKEYLLKEKNLKEGYEEKLRTKEEQIAYYKDYKAKQSTKMIGESLEQHCNLEFNRLRPLFKNAYFEKDNDASKGSKGDFIFRDYDDDGNEIVSIMFEMKNEADETLSKHKNEDFLKELNKDRNEKNCEYAVLVSMLEANNDYYNDGIVDVSHYYDKMYVIRPQFFIPLITLIRNLASKSLEYRKQLELVRNQNVDITHFEEKMNVFKEGFNRNYQLASERFKKAIEEIDKTIEHLQKTKEHLLKTDDNLRLANNKVEDLTIKKLTYNNPTMKMLFQEEKLRKDTLEKEENKEE